MFEALFAPAFARHGLRLLNDSLKIGRLTLQDLLLDELVVLLLGVTRLAATRRNAALWIEVCSTMRLLRAADPDDPDACRKVVDDLSDYTKRVRGAMATRPPSRENAKELTDSLFRFVDREAVRRTFVAYRASDALDMAEEAFRLRIGDVASDAASWAEVCDEFEGVDAVPLMTVHKSKGLEYHTIVFLGIDDNQWWAHSPGQQEGLATFFVGLSRAEKRAMFTFCKARGGRTKVQDLYDLLNRAGVPEMRFS